MSKILNVRLPNATTAQYSPEQFNQLVRSVEQIVLQLNTTYGSNLDADAATAAAWFKSSGNGGGFSGAIPGFQHSSGIVLPHALLESDIDQPNAGITVENKLSFNAPVIASAIYVENNTEIHFMHSGSYLVTISLQITNRGNTAAEFELWFKNKNVNIPLSNTRWDVPPRKSGTVWSHVVPMVSGIFYVDDPGIDYLEAAWWSDSLDVYLESYPDNVNPTRPQIPSIITTVNFVSAVIRYG